MEKSSPATAKAVELKNIRVVQKSARCVTVHVPKTLTGKDLQGPTDESKRK